MVLFGSIVCDRYVRSDREKILMGLPKTLCWFSCRGWAVWNLRDHLLILKFSFSSISEGVGSSSYLLPQYCITNTKPQCQAAVNVYCLWVLDHPGVCSAALMILAGCWLILAGLRWERWQLSAAPLVSFPSRLAEACSQCEGQVQESKGKQTRSLKT